jgi:hypothetical protein
MIKKNSFWLGLVVGIILPFVLFSILYVLNLYTKVFEHPPVILPSQKLMFISSALNIIPIRYYLMHKGLEKTGQGVLFITVFLVIMITLVFG